MCDVGTILMSYVGWLVSIGLFFYAVYQIYAFVCIVLACRDFIAHYRESIRSFFEPNFYSGKTEIESIRNAIDVLELRKQNKKEVKNGK